MCLIDTTADEVHEHHSANPLMQAPPADAAVAALCSEVKLAHYRARRPGGTAMDLSADLATEHNISAPHELAEKIAAQGGSVHAYILIGHPPLRTSNHATASSYHLCLVLSVLGTTHLCWLA